MAYDNKERQEAILAGMRAKDSLTKALNSLNSAKNWGIYDIIGGGTISTFIKHSKMNKASDYLEGAKRDLQSFSKELNDIQYFRLDTSCKGTLRAFSSYDFKIS